MTYKKKLIEVAIPLAKINEEAAREKSIRHGHPSTLHLWWARRPLAACRAVLFAQLVDDPSAHPDRFPTEEAQAAERSRLFDIIERLVPWEASNDESVLAEARAEILKSCDGDLPKVLDPFGGGGAIPLESLRLGLPTYSGDLNPVAVMIQRAMIEIPQRFAGRPPVHPEATLKHTWTGTEGLAADVEMYGKWMQEEARRRIGHHYPDAVLDDGSTATPIAWIWARTVKSPDPSWPGHVPLVRSWILSKKAGKPVVWVEPVVDHDAKTISYHVRTGGTPIEGNVNRQGATCIATGSALSFKFIREQGKLGQMGFVALGVVAESNRGRAYCQPTSRDVPNLDVGDPGFGSLPENPKNFQTPNYGMTEWKDLFTPRQLLALTAFSDMLVDVRAKVMSDARDLPADGVRLRDGGSGRDAYADAIVTYLAFAVDRMTDRNSSICSWDSSREHARNVFARQAIPMTWDYAENNPLGNSSGSLANCVTGITKAITQLPLRSSATTAQRDARARIAEVGTCVISTDPPYYDNISYADLSDFFYVWMRRSLKEVWPDECATLLTPKVDELIANKYRAGSTTAALTHFEVGMQGVFGRAAENADERFPAAVFYAFRATESTGEGKVSTGWETFLSGLLEAGWAITATWPIRTEMVAKIGMNAGDNMLASSIVLACRKRSISAPMATRGEFTAALRAELPPAIKLLQEQNIAPVDMAQSSIGPGIGVFSRYAKVVEADGQDMTVRSALLLINEVLTEVLTGEESELDPDTRFAFTWYEQYGHNPGPYGDADILAKAKDTTVKGVCDSGIALSRDGKLRLVERNELPSDWDPGTDTRLTAWEITQHLIRALLDSETAAARILQKVGGGIGERSRQLAYLLYGICEKRNWADEAAAYNMLVAAWPTIQNLASSNLDGGQSRPDNDAPTLDL